MNPYMKYLGQGAIPMKHCFKRGGFVLEFKDSRWASEIISLQSEEGSWGNFHTLSDPVKGRPITTEQALRRLQILGYTIEDEPIKRAVAYMHECLAGSKQLPDRREKLHNWDIFTSLMLSAWIRRFSPEDALANKTAEKWAEIIRCSFADGNYSHENYVNRYTKVFDLSPRGGRLIDFASFYQVSLLANFLDKDTEQAMFRYLLNYKSGIYYIYDKYLSIPPQTFQSKQASRYLGAMELLSEYKTPTCKEKLRFVTAWLNQNREADGSWDMGSMVKDGVYFPLSDSWRSGEARKQDCTYRITNLIRNIGIGTAVL